MAEEIEILVAVPDKQIGKVGKYAVLTDLKRRFGKALIDELTLNPSIALDYLAPSNTFAQLDEKMKELYTTDNLKDDCSMLKIKVAITVDIQSERSK